MNKEKINVLSLFDGMSCGQLALQRAGIAYDKYFASEIDKYAIKVTQHNFPNTIQLGDVTQVSGDGLPKIDLLIGGSPCQGFSIAGKQLNFDDPRSKLFFEFVRLLKECKPKYFLLENVKMKKEYQDVITDNLGVEPIEINSNLVSAQNRRRLYWTNIPGVTIPEDKGILLKDIVHENEGIDTVLREGYAEWFAKNAEFQLGKKYCSLSPEKAITMTARQYASWGGNYWFEILSEYIVPFDKTLKILDKEVQRGKVGYFRKDSQANRVYYIHDKAITLTGEAGGGAAKMGQYLFGCITPDRVEKRQNGQRFNEVRKFYTLTAQDKHGILIEGYIRKLTPVECERLQTVPDNEISCMFVLCEDQVKNYVNAVEQNPKLLKLALSAEKKELNEFVKLAIQNTKQSLLQTKCTVQQDVDITIPKQINRCTKVNQKESNTNANNAGNIVMYKSQEQEAGSVLQNAFINITEGRITHFGKGELPLKDKSYTRQLSGNKPLKLSGKEIMELVRGVSVGMEKSNDTSSIYTTLSVLSTSSIEQMLATYYLFAKSAITGYIPNTTNQKSLSVQFQINDGYTSIVSNSQRYKMLGNGWTVDVIAHIFKGLK